MGASLVAGLFVDGDPARPYCLLDEPALRKVLEASLPPRIASQVILALREALQAAARRA